MGNGEFTAGGGPFHATGTGLSSGLISFLARMQTLPKQANIKFDIKIARVEQTSD